MQIAIEHIAKMHMHADNDKDSDNDNENYRHGYNYHDKTTSLAIDALMMAAIRKFASAKNNKTLKH
ncbi:hypothetical protein TYRP_016733 [Tyrophagus putrescentiae]|nr:hypothetical protein TYRP_016733 [Tyrophagus putrescentiae]